MFSSPPAMPALPPATFMALAAARDSRERRRTQAAVWRLLCPTVQLQEANMDGGARTSARVPARRTPVAPTAAPARRMKEAARPGEQGGTERVSKHRMSVAAAHNRSDDNSWRRTSITHAALPRRIRDAIL